MAPSVGTAETAPTPHPASATTIAAEPAPAGLQRCEAIRELTTDVEGTQLGALNPDPIFIGAVLSYAEDHPTTFGGMWIDHDSGGTIVLAFTDDPEQHRAALAARRPSLTDDVPVEPRPPIVDDRPIGQWEQRFDVVQVHYSEADLEVAHEELVGRLSPRQFDGLQIGVDSRRNRLALWGVNPTDELLDVASGLSYSDRVCIAERSPSAQDELFEPGDPLEIIPNLQPDGGVWPEALVSCGGAAFPASALDDPPLLVDGDLPGVRRALERFLVTAEGRYWPQDGWMVLTSRRDVLLAHVDADAVSFMTFASTGSGWRWASASSDSTCELRLVLPEGLGAVDWRLDPAFPRPGPDSTEIHLMVKERECASGEPMGDRLLGPQIVQTDQSVLIAFASIREHGYETCPDNPSTAVAVTLSAPLGERDLRDGTTVARDIRELLED